MYKSRLPLLPLLALNEWKRAEKEPCVDTGLYAPLVLVQAAEVPWSFRRQLLLPVTGSFFQFVVGTSVVPHRLLQLSKLSEKEVPLNVVYVGLIGFTVTTFVLFEAGPVEHVVTRRKKRVAVIAVVV